MRLYKIIIFIAKHYFFCNRGNLSKIINDTEISDNAKLEEL